MARNVEIEARVADPPAMRCLVRSLTGSPPEVLVQRDTFLRVAGGRLKRWASLVERLNFTRAKSPIFAAAGRLGAWGEGLRGGVAEA